MSSTRKRRIKEPKRDRKGESGDSKRRKKSSSKGKKSSPPPSISLEHLPTEILQRIFIHSRNPALLECSKCLYYTLSGSSWLHSEIVRASSEEVDDARRLDIRVCGLKFITVDLLKRNNIDTFVDPESQPPSEDSDSPSSTAPEEPDTETHPEPDPNLDVELDQTLALTEEAPEAEFPITDSEIADNEQEQPSEEAPVEEKGPLLPEALELPPFNQRKIEVINYLLEKKCQSRDGSRVVEHAVQNNNEQLVQRLITAGLAFDYKAVVLALEQGYFNIAHTLLSSTVFSADNENLWDHVTKSRNITTFNFLRQYGSPPYHLLT